MGKLADALLHLLARLERDHLFGFDVNSLPGPGVTRLAGFAHFDLEHAKVAQLDASDFDQRVHNGVEGLLDDFFRFELSQADPFRYLLDDFFLGHALVLLTEASGRLRSTQEETLQVYRCHRLVSSQKATAASVLWDGW